MTNSDPRWEIAAVLDRYAECLDGRDWSGLDRVFTEDLVFDFGEWMAESRDQAVTAMRSYLDGCGPTQHLLGNYRIEVAEDGRSAKSRVYVRAFHLGAPGSPAEAEGLTYEMGGEYRDELRVTKDGWRSFRRQGVVLWEQGSRRVLGPGT